MTPDDEKLCDIQILNFEFGRPYKKQQIPFERRPEQLAAPRHALRPQRGQPTAGHAAADRRQPRHDTGLVEVATMVWMTASSGGLFGDVNIE